MKQHLASLLTLWTVSMLLMACGDQTSPRTPLRQPVLLWHAWNDQETTVLNESLAKFTASYPDIQVIQQHFPADDLRKEFVRQARMGLGPDVLILPGKYVRELSNSGLIQPMNDPNLDLSIYFSTALQTLRVHTDVYGLPLSLNTCALYYNKALAAAPPATLAMLIEETNTGKQAALDTSFYGAYWGIQAFGGNAFAPDGRVILNQGGFANWLGWLKKAQNAPNIILSNDRKMLRELFIQKRAAYYVAGSEELSELQQLLGDEVVGVAPLPAGPNNPAGPILETEALFFSAASSPQQADRALRLAQFLTNFEQQTEFLRRLQRIPANSRVWVDPRIYPAAAGFAAQTKTAIAVLNIPQIADVEHEGNDAYIQTLSGVMTPQQAATALTDRVNTRYGFAPISQPDPVICDGAGTVRVWYLPAEMTASALETIQANFQQRCPDITIELQALTIAEDERDADSQVYDQFTTALANGDAPDILIGSNHLTSLLAADGVLHDLSTLVEPEFLQRYLPETLEAMSYQGTLYGLPVSIMELMALYYNNALVTDPPLVLEDLLREADAGRKVIVPVNFYYAYWGLPVFGTRLFDAEYRVILQERGFSDWLNWLKQAQTHDGMIIRYADDVQELQQPFIDGQAAYFAGDVQQLSALQTALGKENLRAIPLPAGPQGQSGPILGVQGIMLNAAAEVNHMHAALTFARYVASGDSQTVLMEQANQAPANINVATTAYPAIAGFMAQARTASVPPIVSQIGNVFYWGNEAYINVLEKGRQPAAVASELANLVNKANGFPVDTSQLPEACAQQGDLTLWHSWSGNKGAALELLLNTFAEACPGIHITARSIPEEKLLQDIETALTPPDLIVTSHSLREPLRRRDVIQNITALVPETTILRYRSGAISALEEQDGLFGVPLACRVTGVFYNPNLVSQPAGTFEALFATPTQPVAVETNFQGAFWGMTALGGQIMNQDGRLRIDPAGLTKWLAFLKTMQATSKVLLNADPTILQDAFVAGNVAYLAADSDMLPILRQALGKDQVGVIPLPAGPDGAPAISFLQVESLFFGATLNEKHTRLALTFADFATSDAMQTVLMHEAHLIPANQLTAVAIDDAALATLSEIVETSVILPDAEEMSRLSSLGDGVYQQVLTGAAEPEEAVRAMLEALNQ